MCPGVANVELYRGRVKPPAVDTRKEELLLRAAVARRRARGSFRTTTSSEIGA
jgi:hypothetical protein